METKKIEISQENVLKAYNDASDGEKKLLENLFGKELFTPKDITERIKTFDDACKELNRRAEEGDEKAAILLADYESNADNIKIKETVAYMKLCIVAYALNEGWEPKFTTDEYRYYPWFVFYTQEEIDSMDKEKKGRVLGRSDSSAGADAGVAYSNTSNASVSSSTGHGARLCFFKKELAEYAGRQFLDIWADFIWPESENIAK